MAKKKTEKKKTETVQVIAPVEIPPDPLDAFTEYELELERRKVAEEERIANLEVSRKNLQGAEKDALLNPIKARHKAFEDAIRKRQGNVPI